MNAAKKRITLPKVLKGIIVAIVLLITLYPILWLITSSFKTNSELAVMPMYKLPRQWVWQNFSNAWGRGNIGLFMINSTIYTVGGIALILVLSLPAAFALSKMRWKLSGAMQSIFTIGITIPFQVTLIPLFIVLKDLHLVNNRLGMVLVYTAFGLPMAIFMFSNFFRTVPNELLEAAFIDGCGLVRTFMWILVPLVGNATVTIVMLQFTRIWNDLLISQTFVNTMTKKSLQTGLLMFIGEEASRDWALSFAAITIGMLPTLFIYFFLNQSIIAGMTAGAIKG